MERYEIDDMKANLQSYLEMQGYDTRSLFNCINPEHTDTNASMKYYDDNKVYCFGCGASFDLIDCISILEHLDKKSAFKRAIDLYSHNYSQTKAKPVIATNNKNKTKEKNVKDYSKAYTYWHEQYKNSKIAKDYVKSRGIDEKLAEKFNFGFNRFHLKDERNNFEMYFNAVVIPASKHCFSARNLDYVDKVKYFKPKKCIADIFNIEAITNDIPYCVITEGEFDCLSFLTIGVNAIALCSANNSVKFFDMQKPFKTYILALDNDETGKKYTNKLIDYFNENNYSYVVFDNCGYKDANLALTQDRNKFQQAITLVCDDIIAKDKRKQKLHDAEM